LATILSGNGFSLRPAATFELDAGKRETVELIPYPKGEAKP
jgi:hypothetical protein